MQMGKAYLCPDRPESPDQLLCGLSLLARAGCRGRKDEHAFVLASRVFVPRMVTLHRLGTTGTVGTQESLLSPHADQACAVSASASLIHFQANTGATEVRGESPQGV